MSVASKARGVHHWIEKNRPDDSELMRADWKEGDVVTSILRCAGGETIVLTHACTLPRPYSRDGRIQGTRGLWLEERDAVFVEDDASQTVSNPDGEHHWSPLSDYKAEYRHPLWVEYDRKGIAKEGHNDMDYLVLCAFADSLEYGEPPIDVYDTATWMAVTYLSEQSVAMGGTPIPMPDFTSGRWLNRTPERRSKYALTEICREQFE